MSAILSRSASAAPSTSAAPSASAPQAQAAPSGTAAAEPASQAKVDVAAVLDGLAKQKKTEAQLANLNCRFDEAARFTQQRHRTQAFGRGTPLSRRYEEVRENERLAAQAGDDQARRKWREGPRRIEAPTVAVTECRITTDQSRRPLCCAMFATFFLLILWARCRYVFNFLQRRIVTRFA